MQSTKSNKPHDGRLDEYLSFARALADEANEIAVAQFGSTVARRKADGSLVTRTDEQIDRMISARIHSRFPPDTVLSEEQETIHDPAVARTWVVDPIDGTTNFARGMPVWGVSIALMQGRWPVVGVISFPLMHETYTAMLGFGARRNDEAIRVAADDASDDEHLFMECTRTRMRYHLDLPLKSRMMGSAAYHICKVAEGSAVAGSEATPKIWDLAAAWLVLREAGGALRSLDGGAVFPLPDSRRDYGRTSWSILYAASDALLEEIRGALRSDW